MLSTPTPLSCNLIWYYIGSTKNCKDVFKFDEFSHLLNWHFEMDSHIKFRCLL